MKRMNEVMPDHIIPYDPNRPGVKFWAAKIYLESQMHADWNRLLSELLEDEKVDLSLDLEIAAYLYQLDKINENSMNLDKKVQRILQKRNQDINTLISNVKRPEPVNEFYSNLRANLEIVNFLTLLDQFEKSILLTESLFETHYRENYGSDINIPDFIQSIKREIETNLDRTMSQEDIKVAINDLIITEIFSFSISWEEDEYVQKFIAILRDALVEKYKE